MPIDMIPFHKFKTLVIEDLAEMRSSMKSMLSSLGIRDITTVNNGEEAVNMMTRFRFNLVFSDYELGRGKDGQQVLEEVRHSKLIKPSSVYILVTAAQTVEMVMGAVEFEPDGYIVKPVTLEILRTRVNRIIRTKMIFSEINKHLDRKQVEEALAACDKLANDQSKAALPAYRIKGRILQEEKRWKEAKELYSKVLDIKQVSWGALGMSKVLYHLGQYAEAQPLLENLVQANAKYVEAQDWLARTLVAEDQYQEAQKVLEAAIEESPKSCPRQQELAHIAELNGDTATVRKACRKALALGKNSVFNQPAPYIRLARAMQPSILSTSLRESKSAFQEATKLLQSARDDFELTPLEQLECALIEAESLQNAKELEAAKKAYAEAGEMLAACTDLSLDDHIDILSSQLLFEEAEEAERIKKELLLEIGDNLRLQTKFYRVLENLLVNKPEERIDLMKTRGKELLQTQAFERARDILLRATRLPNADAESKLLALQALTERFEQGKWNKKYIDVGNVLAADLNRLKETDSLYKEAEAIKERWQQASQPETVDTDKDKDANDNLDSSQNQAATGD